MTTLTTARLSPMPMDLDGAGTRWSAVGGFLMAQWRVARRAAAAAAAYDSAATSASRRVVLERFAQG